jgi:hypothetical protein
MIMDSCNHVFERPKSYNITEFCADGDPNYAVVNLKCSICGVVGSAIANIEWGGIMVDFEWSDEVDIEGYLPTFELQRKEL